MLDLNSQPGKGRLFGIELAGLDKEIKRDRLVSFALWGAAPFLVLNFFYHTLTTIMITQAYLLTSWQFGYIFIVEEFENTKKPWFWKAMVPLILLHLVVLAILFSWDRANPDGAGKGLVLTFVLWVAALPEYYLMLWIVEMCRPSDETAYKYRSR
jgi:nitric oxide reductase large subunit